MDYKIVGIIIGAVVALVLIGKFAIPVLKKRVNAIKEGLELRDYLLAGEAITGKLCDIAKIICDDAGDEVVDKVESVLIDSLNYFELMEDINEINIDDSITYVCKMVELAGIEVTDKEMKLIEDALTIIVGFIQE